MFVTHAHPDHFNGVLELLRGREVPVFATPGVAGVIREIAEAKRAQWGPVYGAEWPAETYYPNTELPEGKPVTLDGLAISAHEVGAAESHADSYLLVRPRAGQSLALLGDLAFHGTHPYTADGHTAAWLGALDRLERDLAAAPACAACCPATVLPPVPGCWPTSGATSCSTERRCGAWPPVRHGSRRTPRPS